MENDRKIYSFFTMEHKVVSHTLSKLGNVEIVFDSSIYAALLYFPYKIISLIKNPLNSFNFQFPSYRYLPSILLLLLFNKEYTISLWGSDYLKVNGFRYYILKFILKNAEKISIASIDTKEFLLANYKKLNNVVVCPYILPNLEMFYCPDKDKIIGKNKLNILLGTNGSSNQQFNVMLSAIEGLADGLLSERNVTFHFHLSYGTCFDVRRCVELFIAKSKFECILEESFLAGAELVKYRTEKDILVQIQKTDQLSAAMLEHLVSGTIVITGAWLPYKSLSNIGVYMKEIEKDNMVNTLIDKLTDTILDIENEKKISSANAKKVIAEYGEEQSLNRWKLFFTLKG